MIFFFLKSFSTYGQFFNSAYMNKFLVIFKVPTNKIGEKQLFCPRIFLFAYKL